MPRKRLRKPPVEKVCICGCGRSFVGRATRLFFNDSCKQRNRNQRIKDRERREAAYTEFMAGLRRAYSRLTFEQFCDVIGEPVTLNETQNRYAHDYWVHFQVATKELGHMGTYLDKVVMWGMENA